MYLVNGNFLQPQIPPHLVGVNCYYSGKYLWEKASNGVQSIVMAGGTLLQETMMNLSPQKKRE